MSRRNEKRNVDIFCNITFMRESNMNASASRQIYGVEDLHCISRVSKKKPGCWMIFCCCVQSMHGARKDTQRIVGQDSNPSNHAFDDRSDGIEMI